MPDPIICRRCGQVLTSTFEEAPVCGTCAESNETAVTVVTLLLDAIGSGQLRGTMIEQRIYAFLEADGDKLAAVALSIGDDLLRWAELVDDDGHPTGTLDEIEHFGEIVQHSSIPEACGQIRGSMIDNPREA
jgi:hypothetical protein